MRNLLTRAEFIASFMVLVWISLQVARLPDALEFTALLGNGWVVTIYSSVIISQPGLRDRVTGAGVLIALLGLFHLVWVVPATALLLTAVRSIVPAGAVGAPEDALVFTATGLCFCIPLVLVRRGWLAVCPLLVMTGLSTLLASSPTATPLVSEIGSAVAPLHVGSAASLILACRLNRVRPADELTCLDCGYSLVGLDAVDPCPECGRRRE